MAMKKLTALILVIAMLLTAAACGNTAKTASAPAPAEERFEFHDWNEGAPALETLIAYVESVTDEKSPDFIPAADRIAVFDMDGTLCAELCPTYFEYMAFLDRVYNDPSYTPTEDVLEVAEIIKEHMYDWDFPSGMDMKHAVAAAKAYAGMSLTEFYSFITQYMLKNAEGFEGMTYGDSFYQPMVEVVDYLNANGFKCYVCSGSDRFVCRLLVEGNLDIPYEQVIGMDVVLEGTNQNGENGLNYVYTPQDEVVRGDTVIIKNLKANKVLQIAQEIGHQPVLAFGNSSGDISMCMYTTSNNKYKSAAFLLVADDAERDHAFLEKAEKMRATWNEYGWNVISMKDDFRTIYGDDVKKVPFDNGYER